MNNKNITFFILLLILSLGHMAVGEETEGIHEQYYNELSSAHSLTKSEKEQFYLKWIDQFSMHLDNQTEGKKDSDFHVRMTLLSLYNALGDWDVSLQLVNEMLAEVKNSDMEYILVHNRVDLLYAKNADLYRATGMGNGDVITTLQTDVSRLRELGEDYKINLSALQNLGELASSIKQYDVAHGAYEDGYKILANDNYRLWNDIFMSRGGIHSYSPEWFFDQMIATSVKHKHFERAKQEIEELLKLTLYIKNSYDYVNQYAILMYPNSALKQYQFIDEILEITANKAVILENWIDLTRLASALFSKGYFLQARELLEAILPASSDSQMLLARGGILSVREFGDAKTSSLELYNLIMLRYGEVDQADEFLQKYGLAE